MGKTMLSNFFMTSKPCFDEMTVQEYKLVTEHTNDKFKIANKMARQLSWRGLAVAIRNHAESLFVQQNDSLEHEVNIDGGIFRLSDRPQTIKVGESPQIFEQMLRYAFKQRCTESGYRFDYEKHICTEKAPMKSDILEYYRGFSYDIEVFTNGTAGIWVDPKIVWRLPLTNLVKMEHDKSRLADSLKGRLVKCYSSTPGVGSYKGIISDVIYDTIGEHKLDDGKNIFEYLSGNANWQKWFKARNINIAKSDGPIIAIKLRDKQNPLKFPPYLIDVLINLDDPLLNKAQKIKLDVGPTQRVEETLALVKKLLSKPLTVGERKIEIKTELLDWSNRENQVYGTPYTLSPPQLVFGGNNRNPPSNWGPNIKACLESYGPITRKEKILVSCICQKGVEDKIGTFFTELNKAAAQLRLASFQMVEPIHITDKTTPEGYALTIKRLQDAKTDVTLVVIPKLDAAIYFYAKRELGAKALSSQMITTDFILAAQNRAKDPNFDKFVTPKLLVMAAQMYDKSLGKGESMWHLAGPAGELDGNKKIYFMGFDVSRNPKNHKESAAYAAICDSLGRVLQRKTLDSHKGELISAEELKQWFFDAASDAYVESEKDSIKKIDELILFKDGRIDYSEIENYRRGAEEAKKVLVEHGIMTSSSNIRIVSVVKSGPHRVYGAASKQYGISEIAILRDDKHAIIVTAKPKKGTQASLRLNIEFELTPDMKINQLCQVFNQLRYLDWSSIYSQPKTILPLHIVQNLAKLSKEDITVPYIPR